MLTPMSPSDIRQEVVKFSNYLKKKNLKITTQRLLIAEKIFSSKNHFRVEDLFDLFKDKRDEISRATVYRTVALLVESGQLAEHDFGQASKFYEFCPTAREHHDHIVCLDCGNIEEFYDSKIEKIQSEIIKKFDYELVDHSLNLYGKCIQLKTTGFCSKKNSKQEKIQEQGNTENSVNSQNHPK
ncbi:MAG: Fur family transcriptional regulator [Leptonema sp. (in: bacteria)]